MNLLISLMNNKYIIWAGLSVPVVFLLIDVLFFERSGASFFYWTGAVSMWLIFITLAASPLLSLSNKSSWSRWFMKQRRYIGVAAFVYMAAHTAYWMQEVTWHRVFISSWTDPAIAVGWFSGFVFLAMAITSNNYSVRKLGPTWKKVQSWVYIGTPLALLHWFIAESFRLRTVVIYGAITIVLILLRIAAARYRKDGPGRQSV